MIYGRIFAANDNTCLIHRVLRTTNFLERMRGLLFVPPLKTGEALLIKPCRSVHTMGMAYAIDLVFLDSNWGVVKIVSNLSPWHSASCKQATMVLELMGDGVKPLKLNKGQHLEWHNET